MDFLDQPPAMWDWACHDPDGNEGTICIRPNRAAIEAGRLYLVTALHLIYDGIPHPDHLGKWLPNFWPHAKQSIWLGRCFILVEQLEINRTPFCKFMRTVRISLLQRILCRPPLYTSQRLRNRTAGVTYLCTFLHGVILWTPIFYLPLYSEAVEGFTGARAGIAVFPETLTVAPASLIMAFRSSRAPAVTSSESGQDGYLRRLAQASCACSMQIPPISAASC